MALSVEWRAHAAQRYTLVVALAVSLPLCGCAGSSMTVWAPDVAYPVSFTRSVFDEKGEIVTPSAEEKVEHFEFGMRQWSILFGLVPLGGRAHDISPQLTELIKAHQGDAIVNLTMTTQLPWYWYFTALLLIFPQDVTVDVEGDVVRLER